MNRRPPDADALSHPFNGARWHLIADRVPSAGIDWNVIANDVELAALEKILELESCRSFEVVCRVERGSRGQFTLQIALRADVEQGCVVTLESVDVLISETVSIVFWPKENMPTREDAEDLVTSGEPPELLEGGVIDVGRMAYELLAVSIDPYPRKSDAVIIYPGRESSKNEQEGRESPFSVLSSFKERD